MASFLRQFWLLRKNQKCFLRPFACQKQVVLCKKTKNKTFASGTLFTLTGLVHDRIWTSHAVAKLRAPNSDTLCRLENVPIFAKNTSRFVAKRNANFLIVATKLLLHCLAIAHWTLPLKSAVHGCLLFHRQCPILKLTPTCMPFTATKKSLTKAKLFAIRFVTQLTVCKTAIFLSTLRERNTTTADRFPNGQAALPEPSPRAKMPNRHQNPQTARQKEDRCC